MDVIARSETTKQSPGFGRFEIAAHSTALGAGFLAMTTPQISLDRVLPGLVTLGLWIGWCGGMFRFDAGEAAVYSMPGMMHRGLLFLLFAFLLPGPDSGAPVPAANRAARSAAGLSSRFVELPGETVEDKIRGGLLGQLLGNLNGLPHENRYYDEPGNVTDYTPALPDGARTDDDTDIEWVYITAMQRSGTTLLAPRDITRLWKEHINEHIWCSNLYVRRLMDIGLDPPLTGSLALNPWGNFNISGQFLCEMFGLISPGMPQTAGRIGVHYTHVSIDGEPAQATQLFTAMIATAFTTDNIEEIVDAGQASIDRRSELGPIVADVRGWHRQYLQDWRATRGLIRDKYTLYESRTRNQNGYELCTAATVAALLYGGGDFTKTLRHAFNFGWDADNNAATAATIVGVIKGCRWMQQQGWHIKDQYHNTTRPGMPDDETITSFGDRIIEAAGRVITENGGGKASRDGKTIYRIRVQKPGNVEPLPSLSQRVSALQSELGPQIKAGLGDEATTEQQARAAYLAICLGLADSLRRENANRWDRALACLGEYPGLLDVLFNKSPGPAGDRLRAAAAAAGVKEPGQQKQ